MVIWVKSIYDYGTLRYVGAERWRLEITSRGSQASRRPERVAQKGESYHFVSSKHVRNDL